MQHWRHRQQQLRIRLVKLKIDTRRACRQTTMDINEMERTNAARKKTNDISDGPGKKTEKPVCNILITGHLFYILFYLKKNTEKKLFKQTALSE